MAAKEAAAAAAAAAAVQRNESVEGAGGGGGCSPQQVHDILVNAFKHAEKAHDEVQIVLLHFVVQLDEGLVTNVTNSIYACASARVMNWTPGPR